MWGSSPKRLLELLKTCLQIVKGSILQKIHCWLLTSVEIDWNCLFCVKFWYLRGNNHSCLYSYITKDWRPSRRCGQHQRLSTVRRQCSGSRWSCRGEKVSQERNKHCSKAPSIKYKKTHDTRSAPDNTSGFAASRSAKQASIVLLVGSKNSC